MKKLWLASAMVVVMATPAAFAQSTTTSETSRSVTQSGDVNEKRSETTVDSDGTAVERSKSVKSDADGGVRVKRSEKVTDTNGREVERSKTYSKDDAGKTVTSQTKKKTPEGTEETTRTTTLPPN